jgi:hypothetical protein
MRLVLVALGSAVLLVSAILTTRTDAGSSSLPSWIPAELGGLAIRPATPGEALVDRSFAVEAVRRAVFLDAAPEREPLSFATLVTGRVARGQLPTSPSGEVDIPNAEDVPTWLVLWRGLEGDDVARFGTWSEGALVDAVFLVDGVTGDCCLLNLFLTGDSRLG